MLRLRVHTCTTPQVVQLSGADGSVKARVTLPSLFVTSVAFVGPILSDLVVTVAADAAGAAVVVMGDTPSEGGGLGPRGARLALLACDESVPLASLWLDGGGAVFKVEPDAGGGFRGVRVAACKL